MATLIHDFPHFSLAHPLAPVQRLVARVQAWQASRREYAEAMRSLGQIDARDMHDLGINRGDFESIARGTYRR